MKIKLLFLLLFCALSPLSLASFAQDHHLTAEQAMQRIGLQQCSLGTMHRAPSAAADRGNDLYYIFNLDEGGFIIASADDRARAILGRCDEGTWDPNNIPPAMQGWLNNMSEALKALQTLPQPLPEGRGEDTTANDSPLSYGVTSPLPRREGAGVGLLGDITWGQGEPYFNECPAIGSSHSATGCAATAMAQIMRFHSYPERGAGSNSYVSETIKFQISEDFSQTTYDWANMKTSYPMSVDGKTKYYTDNEATAVARLMYHLGAASNMDYNTGASGTTEAPMLRAMTENFQYDRSLQIYYRDYFTSPEWYALLQSEIDARRPVLMNGYSISGGHAFVIDGYDTTMGPGYFHFNWGWNGMSNGYYSVDITDPGQQGIGGSLGGYSYNQNIFVGIQPPTGVTATAQPNLCVTEALKYAREQVYFAFRNRGCGTFTGQVGYAVEQNGQTSFTSLGTLNNAGFNEGGNYHFTPAVTTAGARVYAAYRTTDGQIAPMAPIVGTPSVLVSQLNGTKVVYVAESQDMPQLEVTALAIVPSAGSGQADEKAVSYVGYNTTFNFTVRNTGKAEYNGPLYLCINELDEAGNPTIEEYHTADNPLGVYIRPGESYSGHMTYYNDTYLLAGHKYSCEIIYNARNSSSFVHIPGTKCIFDVELYKAPTPKNPPVIKVLSQELSATTVEQGKQLSLKLRVNNTGGTDPVPAGGVIYQKKGSSPKGYLGEQVVSFPQGESEWTFTGAVNVEPGSYRLLPGWDDNGWWELWNYDYLYFDVTECTDPVEPVDPIDPDQPDPGVDPDKPDPGVDPDQPVEPEVQYVDLQLDDVYAYHYANEKFSRPGAYDYFFNYGCLADENGFPWLLFHILQPSNDGICEGTYSIAAGTLRPLILRSMDDYNAYKVGQQVNALDDATVTLSNKGAGTWQMHFEGKAQGANIIYRADTTRPITASTTQDANDPLVPGGGNVDPDQPVEPDVVNLDINYCEVELWTNPQFSPDGHYDYYFQMVKLEDGAAHANKWPFVDFDLYLPVKGQLQAGSYMLGDKFKNFALIQNNEDEQAYENWTDNYGFKQGCLTLTHNGGDNWTIEVEMTAADGTLYLINMTQDITLRWRDEDPMVNPGINDTFNKESTTEGDYTVVFDLLDTSEQFIADRGFFYVNLESKSEAASHPGARYVSEFYFRTEPTAVNVPAGTYRIPAGTYPVNYDDDSHLSFVASHGDGMTGGQYPSFIGLYDGSRITDVWYLAKGSITVSYDAHDALVLTGDLESHYGSKFHIAYNAQPDGIGTVLAAPISPKARKEVQGGRINIRRDGRTYNMLGTRTNDNTK